LQLTVSAAGPHLGSGSTESTEMRKLLEKQLQDRRLIGMAALVIRSHTIVGIAAAGVRRQEESRLLESTDLFHLGSTTKALTATMIARLVEARKLSWTTTALELFPELTQVMHPGFRHITLEQLLSHHAGVPPYDTFTVSLRKNTWPKPLPHLSGTEAQQRSEFAAWVLRRRPAVPRERNPFIPTPTL
jgi:CubicO group peptidase (beta-lactamase class C family)